MSRRLQSLEMKKEALLKSIKEEAERDRRRGRVRDTRLRVRLGALTMKLLLDDPALRERFKSAAQKYFKHGEARCDLALDEAETWFDRVGKPLEDEMDASNHGKPESPQAQSSSPALPSSGGANPAKQLPVVVPNQATQGAQVATNVAAAASAALPRPAAALTKANAGETSSNATGAP